MLQHWFDRVDDAMGLLARAVKDPEPRVRLEAVRALSFVPTAEAASTALQSLPGGPGPRSGVPQTLVSDRDRP